MGNSCCRSTDVVENRNRNNSSDKKYADEYTSLVKAYGELLDETKIIPWTNKMEQECPICLQNFEKNDAVYLTNCIHIYHFNCLALWAPHQMICPICRFSLV